MDIQRIHDSIIGNAKSYNRRKSKSVYYEEHHIIPRCMGGTNDKSNLVLLTAKEHYVIHKLLTYIYKGNAKLIYAYNMLMNVKQHKQLYKLSSRDYAYLRELRHSLIGTTTITEEHKDAVRKAQKGRTHTKEEIEKQVESSKQTYHSEEKKRERYLNNILHPNVRVKPLLEDDYEVRLLVSKRQKGRVKSKEEIDKQKETKRIKREERLRLNPPKPKWDVSSEEYKAYLRMKSKEWWDKRRNAA